MNNRFLEASRAEIALTYNDQAVLENHHAATAFLLMRRYPYITPITHLLR